MTGTEPDSAAGPPADGAPPSGGDATPVASALERALSSHLLAGRRTADLGQALVAAITLFALAPVVPRSVVIGWAVGFTLAMAIRAGARRWALARTSDPGRRLRILRFDVWGSGVLWGVWTLLLVGADPQSLAILLILLAGLIAAATSTLVADGPAFLGFAGTLLVPALVTVTASGTSRLHLSLAIMIVIYGPFMVTVYRRAHALLVGQIVNGERLRRSTEEAARGRDFLDAIFTSAPSAIVVLAADGRVQRASPALERMLGFTSAEVLGRPFEELAPDDVQRRRLRAFLARARTSSPATVEVPMMRSLGDQVWLRLSGTSAEGLEDALVLVGEDVSEQVVAREARERARVAAEQAARAKSSFLASMSHEIRTPMNGILGMIELLLDTELSTEQRESAEIIRSSGRGLLRILNDILDISKMEAGQLDLEDIPFDLRDAVGEAVQLHRMAAQARGLELRLDVASEVPGRVIGDPVRLRQVLSNLLANAIKFTEEGRVVVDVALASAEGSLRFSVEDTGIGIPEDKLAAVFQEFEQADTSTTRRYGGAGLGLAICRRLVTLMNGTLEVHSEPGKGSRFTFVVPLPAAHVPEDRERRSTGNGVSGQRFLVVSDAPVERRLIREVLLRGRASGVVEVGSAERAVVELRGGEAFAVMIVDHAPPATDGVRLARETIAERETTGTRVLLLDTGAGLDTEAVRSAGVVGVLTKPVTRTTLLGALGEVLSWPSHDGPERRLVTERTPPRPVGDVRILLVEDNAVNLQVALSLLQKRGYDVTTATDGALAVDIASRERFDIVLMDIQMPVMDGFEAVRRIRAMPEHADTPIAALTAHAFQEERDRCAEVGMDDFLAKPFTPADLYALVERWTGPAARVRVPRPEPEPPRPSPRDAEDGRGPVDVDAFRRAMRTAGVEDVVDTALAVYADEAPVLFGRIEEAVQAGDPEAIRVQAHSLKSSSANIRANRLADMLRTLEHHGRDGDVEGARGLVGDVRRELDEALEQIRALQA